MKKENTGALSSMMEISFSFEIGRSMFNVRCSFAVLDSGFRRNDVPIQCL